MGKTKDIVIPTPNTHNVLATGTRIKGDVCAEEDFRIDGAIEGNIECKGKIVIGYQSVITGTITCANIEVIGQVNGNISCSESAILRASARLTGDIKMQTIEIEPGAKFIGACSMLDNTTI